MRSSSITLQTARQLEVFAGGDGTGTEAAWEAIAVAQHHDAVSGTERQHVAYDYTQRIAKGMAVAYRTLDSALSRLAANGTTPMERFISCPLLNISVCPPIRAGTNGFTVIVYNPRAHSRNDSIVLPYYGTTRPTVTDSTGAEVPSELVPVPRTSALRNESAAQSLHITPKTQMPGLAFETFTVKPQSPKLLSRLRGKNGKAASQALPMLSAPTGAMLSIESASIRLTFDNSTGLIQSWTDVSSQTVHALSQSFFYYQSSVNSSEGTSNSYTFVPKAGTTLVPISTAPVQLTTFTGERVQVVHQRWNDWVSQTWTLHEGSMMPEVEFTIGPIAFEDGISREVVTKYTTDIQSQGELWTDANGREFQRRVRNQRLSFNYSVVDPIAGNYFPITTSLKLNDSNTAFAVLVDRAEGGASLQDGAIELMVHRRLLCGCGFDEALNETAGGAVYNVERGELVERLGPGLVVTGKHRLLLGDTRAVQEAVRTGPGMLYTPYHTVVAPSAAFTTKGRVGSLSFLRTPLPVNVDLISLHVLFDGSVLLRLAHSFAVNDDTPLAAPVDVDLSTLFVQPIQSIKQRTLTANADYKARVRSSLPFETVEEIGEAEWDRAARMHQGLQDTTITIHPMQIVTFALSF